MSTQLRKSSRWASGRMGSGVSTVCVPGHALTATMLDDRATRRPPPRTSGAISISSAITGDYRVVRIQTGPPPVETSAGATPQYRQLHCRPAPCVRAGQRTHQKPHRPPFAPSKFRSTLLRWRRWPRSAPVAEIGMSPGVISSPSAGRPHRAHRCVSACHVGDST